MSDEGHNVVFNAEQKAKLVHLFNEGIAVLTEVDTLRGGLDDTVKAIAEDMQIKPSVLKKALNTAYKSSFTDTRHDFDTLETILETVGKTW